MRRLANFFLLVAWSATAPVLVPSSQADETTVQAQNAEVTGTAVPAAAHVAIDVPADTVANQEIPVINQEIPADLATDGPVEERAVQTERERIDFAHGLFGRGMFDMSVDEYQKFSAEFPASPYLEEALLGMAESYFALNNYQKALDGFVQFRTRYPASEKIPTAVLRIGQLNIQLKKYDIAVQELATLDAEARVQGQMRQSLDYYLGKAYRGQHDLDNALIWFKKSVEVPGASTYTTYAWGERGEVLGEQEKFPEAAVALDQGIMAATDDNYRAYLKEQKVRLVQEKTFKDRALYEALLNTYKSNDFEHVVPQAQEYMNKFADGEYYEQVIMLEGDVFAKLKQYQMGVDLVTAYIAQATTATGKTIKRSDGVYFVLGFNLQQLGQADAALEAYSKATLNPDDPHFYASALKNASVIHLNRNEQSQAIALLDRLITDVHKNYCEFPTYVLICEYYLKEKRFDDVIRIAHKAQEYFPNQNFEVIAFFKAEALRENKDLDNAIKQYDIVLSASKNYYTTLAHMGKGLTLREKGQFNEAKTEFQSVIEDNSDSREISLKARFEIADTAAAQGNLDEAVRFYLLIPTIYEDPVYNPQCLLKAGALLEELHRHDEAVQTYGQIVEKYKDAPAAAAAKERIAFLNEPKN